LAFYRLANDNALSGDEQRACLELVHLELSQGGRSPGWDFGANIARARELKLSDEEVHFLVKLASVINDESPMDTLTTFEQWPTGAPDA